MCYNVLRQDGSYCNAWGITPGVIRFFSGGDGRYTPGGYTPCTKRFPWAIRAQKRKIAEKKFFLTAKNGGYTPGDYTPGGLYVHQALQY